MRTIYTPCLFDDFVQLSDDYSPNCLTNFCNEETFDEQIFLSQSPPPSPLPKTLATKTLTKLNASFSVVDVASCLRSVVHNRLLWNAITSSSPSPTTAAVAQEDTNTPAHWRPHVFVCDPNQFLWTDTIQPTTRLYHHHHPQCVFVS